MQRLAATLTAGSVPDAGGGKRMAATGKGRDDPEVTWESDSDFVDEVRVELAAGGQFTRL
jgi:hypothetical protein